MNKCRRKLLALVTAGTVPGLGLSCLTGENTLAADKYDLSAENAVTLRRLRFALTLVNPHQRMLERQRLSCYLPADLPPAQQLRQVQVSMPHRIETDVWGHRILVLDFAQIAPLAQKVVSVTALLACTPAPPASLPDPQVWLQPERFMESADARLQKQAALLLRASPAQSARAIYDWVRQHMHYAGYVLDDLGALHALETGQGDCTEYADLVVALARACGIPARMAGGYVVNGDASVRGQDYHNWAELFLDGAWCVVDAQKERWQPPRNDYILFRIYRDAASNAVWRAHRFLLDGELQVIF